MRPRDKILCCGVGFDYSIKSMKYYQMSANTLNSFSKEEAEGYVKYGYRIISVKDKQVIHINEILKEAGAVDFLSIDVEGLDFLILKAMDFALCSPRVVCIESCEFGAGKREDFSEIYAYMKNKGYVLFFETEVNSIFVLKEDYLKWSDGMIGVL